MKIYVVTKGSYSDYHIIAATLDKEKAYELAKRCNDNWDDAEVEEYEDFELVNRDIWSVTFDTKFNIIIVEKTDYYESAFRSINMFIEYHGGRYGAHIYVAADTEEEAIKIAAEKKAEYFAHKNGIA